MSNSDSTYGSAVREGGEDNTDQTVYRVVLEGVKPGIETPDAFAIKYGILTSTPVTRVKFLMRGIPRTILETKSIAKARGALELIEEAGGVGRVEGFDPEAEPTVEISEEEPVKASSDGLTCSSCGFPIREGDEFCQFCRTPLVQTKSYQIKKVLKAGGDGHLIPPRRLLIYVAIVAVALLIGILTR